MQNQSDVKEPSLGATLLTILTTILACCVANQFASAQPTRDQPTLGAADLAPCASEIAALATVREASGNPIQWFLTANDGEGGAPYMLPFNGELEGDLELLNRDLASRSPQPPAAGLPSWDQRFYEQQYAEQTAQRCVARLWLAQFDAQGASGAAVRDDNLKGELTQLNGADTAEDADGEQGSATECRATPDQTVAAFYSDFTTFSNTNPPPSQALGARAQYQWSYFLAVEALRRIEPLRACLGPHYGTLLRDYTAMSKSGKAGCDQLASGREPCPSTYPR